MLSSSGALLLFPTVIVIVSWSVKFPSLTLKVISKLPASVLSGVQLNVLVDASKCAVKSPLAL